MQIRQITRGLLCRMLLRRRFRNRTGRDTLPFPKRVLAVLLRDYGVICPPVNPRCAPARLRLTGGLSLVLTQNSALKILGIIRKIQIGEFPEVFFCGFVICLCGFDLIVKIA
jgi:hypothetical protein